MQFCRSMILMLSCGSVALSAPRTWQVPGDFPTIQPAIDAAADGDTVRVAPGVYPGDLKIDGKNILLTSTYSDRQNEQRIAQTILDGSVAGKKKTSILMVGATAGAGSRLMGFTIRNADHAVVVAKGRLEVAHNHFTGNSDALSFEDGSGFVHHNIFENDSDDGIDLDGASAAVIEDNVIRNNKDDGIEVRLHKYQGPRLEIVVRRNLISGNREDGLQLIDYPGKSSRTFRVERNVIANNAMAGIGSMEDGNTTENYQGAGLLERLFAINNTIVGNAYGITGGDNFILLNNIIANSSQVALKRIHGDSVAASNLLWKNMVDREACDLSPSGFVEKDPLLDGQHRPRTGSPCIDGGQASLHYQGEVLVLPPQSFTGSAPDVGAVESDRN